MDISVLNEYVQTIGHTAHYWMVRTMGGQYYENFVSGRYIAVGPNDITLHEIIGYGQDGKKSHPALRKLVASRHPDVARPGHIASQLYRFCNELQVGDIVVVPSYSSFEISVCRITGSVYEDVNTSGADGDCPFMKRIPVEIIKKVKRGSLPPKAQLMFNSRHPISDISEYATYIDGTCLDYYNKNDETHVVLKINTEDAVAASTFYNMQKLFEIAERFCRDNNMDGNASEVTMTVQMESPGALHFISKNKNFLAIVGLVILFINGGGLKIDYGQFHLDLSTDGIFKNISEYLDRRTDREMRESIKNSMDSLKIDTPADFQKAMIELYQTQNENRKKY